MEKPLHFRSSCPRCGKYGIIQIVASSQENESFYLDKFHCDEWRGFDFGLFSVACYCAECKNYVSASVSVAHDEIKNATAKLVDFADDNNRIKLGPEIMIDFDVPTLLPPQHFSSPPIVSVSDIYNQARKCYSLQAWEAVGILCRKIVDIQSIFMWDTRYPGKPHPTTLAQRLEDLLVKGVKEKNKVERSELSDVLNFDSLKHRLFYDMDRIRESGNDAAHGLLAYHDDEAEAMLIFTQKFLDESESWMSSLRRARVKPAAGKEPKKDQVS
ncbi:DUF4145 domain-containing protein [Pseudomonas sp. 17391]|uniref:DUF4145 domain-containing protein n=1 Tax=Pseudomonas sp. 17391 TaxID=2967217 RepID=UPI0023633FFC|nr:DUF4145 domain-containing protein [Pseudomonas sp. 17391]MDD2127947.1 DUF4145 domain-containing protein [Pseudomonas sp. 17391]